MLASEGIGIGALLDFGVFVSQGGIADTGEVAGLIDEAADGGGEDLMAALESHGAFGEGDAGIAAQLTIDIEEQGDVAVDGDGEGIDLDGRNPGGFVLVFGG